MLIMRQTPSRSSQAPRIAQGRGWPRTVAFARRAGASLVTSALGAEDGWGCPRTGPGSRSGDSITCDVPRHPESYTCPTHRHQRIPHDPSAVLALALALVSTIALQAQPASVAGAWTVNSLVSGNESTQTCTFTQKDADRAARARAIGERFRSPEKSTARP